MIFCINGKLNQWRTNEISNNPVTTKVTDTSLAHFQHEPPIPSGNNGATPAGLMCFINKILFDRFGQCPVNDIYFLTASAFLCNPLSFLRNCAMKPSVRYCLGNVSLTTIPLYGWSKVKIRMALKKGLNHLLIFSASDGCKYYVIIPPSWFDKGYPLTWPAPMGPCVGDPVKYLISVSDEWAHLQQGASTNILSNYQLAKIWCTWTASSLALTHQLSFKTLRISFDKSKLMRL